MRKDGRILSLIDDRKRGIINGAMRYFKILAILMMLNFRFN
jgi:hypothetical protein